MRAGKKGDADILRQLLEPATRGESERKLALRLFAHAGVDLKDSDQLAQVPCSTSRWDLRDVYVAACKTLIHNDSWTAADLPSDVTVEAQPALFALFDNLLAWEADAEAQQAVEAMQCVMPNDGDFGEKAQRALVTFKRLWSGSEWPVRAYSAPCSPVGSNMLACTLGLHSAGGMVRRALARDAAYTARWRMADLYVPGTPPWHA